MKHNIQALGTQEIFPVELIQYQLDNELIEKVLGDISSNKDKIIESHRDTHPKEEGPECYYTDYHRPTNLPTVDTILKALKEDLESKNMQVVIHEYWTAAYRKEAEHNTHIHKYSTLDSANYSGIIYLTKLGRTSFFNNCTNSRDYLYQSHSYPGKITMFPSTLLHSVPSHRKSDWRYVVAFNMSIYHKG